MNYEEMTPEQLSQPVNGYAMLAMTREIRTLNSTMSLVVEQTKSVVTPDQLVKTETELKKHLEERLIEEIAKVHLEYRPIKKGALWFAGIIVVALVGIYFTAQAQLAKLL